MLKVPFEPFLTLFEGKQFRNFFLLKFWKGLRLKKQIIPFGSVGFRSYGEICCSFRCGFP